MGVFIANEASSALYVLEQAISGMKVRTLQEVMASMKNSRGLGIAIVPAALTKIREVERLRYPKSAKLQKLGLFPLPGQFKP